jgi:Peptidase family M23
MKNRLLLVIIFVVYSIISNAQTYSWLYPENIEKKAFQNFGCFEYSTNFHEAIDFAAPFNTIVYAICNGVATVEEPILGGETRISIECSDTGEKISYNHLVNPQIATDSIVQEGDLIGYVIEDHVHMSISSITGVYGNPLINPHFPYSEFPQPLQGAPPLPPQPPEFGAFYIKNKITEEYEKTVFMEQWT